MLFGGKGGVGKTSCATATALEVAKQGKKVLVLSTDPAHSLSDSLKCNVKNEITNITENLDALEIDAEGLLKEFREEHGDIIRQIVNEGTYLKEEDIDKFSELSWPGLDEVMALGKVTDFLDENEYDLYILDTAPTGHTIRLIALPDLMTKWVEVLVEMHKKKDYIRQRLVGRSVEDEADRFLKKQKKRIERIKTALMDVQETQFDVITIPEAMSVDETKRFVKILETYKIPINHIIINRVVPINNCKFCVSRRKEQLKYIRELEKEFFRYGIIEIPLFPNEIRGLDKLANFSQALFKENYKVKYESFKMPIFSKSTLSKPSKIHDVLKEDLKLLLFGGKGGVGKTSCATATALEAAKQGKKVLVFSTDPAHSLSDSFGCSIGDKITKVTKNIHALEIDAQKLFNELKEEYREEIKKFFGRILKPSKTTGIGLPFDEKIMSGLYDLNPPGVDELMALKKIIEFIESKQYDLFILDTAPTGHTLRLLALPDDAIAWTKTIIEVRRNYPIMGEVGGSLIGTLKTIKKAKKTLTDPKKTEFIGVTIAEAMGVYQTERLIKNLKILKIPVEHLIINKIIPANRCNLCLSQKKQQKDYINEISKKFSGCKIIEMPQFESEIKGLKKLTKFSEILFR